MALKYEVTANGGTYTKDGVEKKRYIRCGAVFENVKGELSAKIDSLPVNFDGWLNFWTPKEKERVPGQDDDWK